MKPNADKGDRPEATRQEVSLDITRCRARRSGFGEWVDCLMPEPEHCPHAVTYGPSYFCTHVQRAEIAARCLKADS